MSTGIKANSKLTRYTEKVYWKLLIKKSHGKDPGTCRGCTESLCEKIKQSRITAKVLIKGLKETSSSMARRSIMIKMVLVFSKRMVMASTTTTCNMDFIVLKKI